MPHAIAKGIRIHYEIEGAGPPLVLLHGFTSSLQEWYEYGYVEPLARHYQVILTDNLGHGGSGKPHDAEAYSAENRVRSIVGVIDDVGVDRVHFTDIRWSHSRVPHREARTGPPRFCGVRREQPVWRLAGDPRVSP